jgi:glucokinase
MSIIVGMDIGGTSIKAGAWDGDKRLVWHDALAIPQTANEGTVADRLAGYVQDVVAELPSPPAALGIGSCGLIAGGVIFQSPNTPWERLPLVELMTHRFKYPAYLLNDADAFLLAAMSTLAEQRCLALGITLGTGIGTALWMNDRLFTGGAGVSPEGGHITLGIDRSRSNTGIPGSWESLAGRDALLRHYNEAGGGDSDNPRAVAEAARRGEPAAVTAWNRYGRYVGAGLGSLCNVLSVDYVLIGGGMVEAHDVFELSMNAAIERHLLKAMPRPEVHFIEGAPDTVAHGAARHAAMKLGKSKGG